MDDPKVIAAIITAAGALIGVIVAEWRRGRAQKSTKAQIEAVLHQVEPNSGKSLHDAVTRIERKTEAIDECQRDFGQRLAVVEARVSDQKRWR